MKKILLVFVCLGLFPATGLTQTLVSFTGGTMENDRISLDFTSGEIVSGTFSSEAFQLTAGIFGEFTETPTSTENKTPEITGVFELSQNYPNPFNPVTVIGFNAPVKSEVNLEVFDVLGRQVTSLVSGQTEAGRHTTEFDASTLAGGLYIYRLVADGKLISTRKMIFIK